MNKEDRTVYIGIILLFSFIYPLLAIDAPTDAPTFLLLFIQPLLILSIIPIMITGLFILFKASRTSGFKIGAVVAALLVLILMTKAFVF